MSTANSEEEIALWSSEDSDEMIEVVISLYGGDAVTAVAWCVLDAKMAGRKSDSHFGLRYSNA